MRNANKLSIFVLCLALATFSSDAFSAVLSVISAPLDGGLLTILGAAGVSYYLIRKKKGNN